MNIGELHMKVKVLVIYLGGALHGIRRKRLIEITGLDPEEIMSLNDSLKNLIPGQHKPEVVIVSSAAHKTLKKVKAAQELFPDAKIIVRGFRVDGLEEDIPVVPSKKSLNALLKHFPTSLSLI